MMLLVDIGNTRIKWATYDTQGLGRQQAAVHAGWSYADLQQHIVRTTATPDRILVSNVAGPQLAALLTDVVTEAWSKQPDFVHAGTVAAGVHNAYVEPAKLGVDRWLGMIAAHRMAPGAVCVVSVGTALTIDGVDAAGRHLGGLITPGPQLMVRSLLGGTSDIAARAGALHASDAIFCTDTAAAIHNGARHALAALIVRAADWTERQTGERPTVILTGGAASQVETILPWSCRTAPDLVLQGLAVIADEQG
jgi:type III pantothenate kinase